MANRRKCGCACRIHAPCGGIGWGTVRTMPGQGPGPRNLKQASSARFLRLAGPAVGVLPIIGGWPMPTTGAAGFLGMGLLRSRIRSAGARVNQMECDPFAAESIQDHRLLSFTN